MPRDDDDDDGVTIGPWATAGDGAGDPGEPAEPRRVRRRKPYKFTDSRREEYLENLRQGMRRGAAAEAAGVSRQVVLAYRQADPAFEAAVDQAELDANEAVEDALYQAALAGNVRAAELWLTNRAPTRWRAQQRLDITSGGAVISGGVAALSAAAILLDDAAIELACQLAERVFGGAPGGAVDAGGAAGARQLAAPVIEGEFVGPGTGAAGA